MNQPSRPFYITGGSLPPGALSYVEREADAELFTALRAGEFCYVLTPRQMGKSSLIVRTAERLRQAGCAVTVLDPTAIGQNASAEQWYFGLALHLGEQLGLAADVEDLWEARSGLAPLQRWLSVLRHVVSGRAKGKGQEDDQAKGKGQRANTAHPTEGKEQPARGTGVAHQPPLVVFIDEVDFVRSLPFPTDEFFAGIRHCYHQRSEDPVFEHLAFCLMGVTTPADLIQDPHTTPFNIGRRIELHDFTPEEAAPLGWGLGVDEPIASDLMARVHHWTGGHPYLTQRLCQAVVEDGTVATAEGVDRVCEQVFLGRRAREIDPNLTFVRDRLLKTPVDRADLLTLYQRVWSSRRGVADDDANPLVSALKLSGVARTEGGQLKVRNRIYERVFDRKWIVEQMPDAELRRQKAAYRRGLVRALTVAAVIVAIIAALAGLAVRSARQAREAESRERDQRQLAETSLVRMYVATGLRLVESGDSFQALLWFAEALRREPDPEQQAMHRMRFATTLRQCPRLVRICKDVEAAAFTADGSRLLVAHGDTVQAWDTLTGEVVAPPVRHPGKVWAIGPQGRRVLIGLSDRQLQVQQASADRALTPPFECQGPVTSAVFSAKGHRVLTTSEGNILQVWDADTGKPLADPLKHNGGQIVFSPDGRRGATFQGNTVQVWNLDTGKPTASVEHGAGLLGVAFSPDGSQVVTCGYSGEVRVWDAANGRPLHTLRMQGIQVAFSPEGRRLVVGEDNSAQVFEVATERKITPPLPHGSEVRDVSFSPDGQYVLTVSSDATARVWDAETGQPVAPPLQRNKGFGLDIMVRFSPEGRWVLMQDGGMLHLWDLAPATLAGPPLLHRERVERASFSPDGGRVVTASWPGATARVWEAATGKPVTPPLRHRGGYVGQAEFSPDGGRVVTAGGIPLGKGEARVWDAATGQPVTPPLEHPYEVGYAEFSPDGGRIVTASGYGNPPKAGEARVWEAATGKLLHTLAVPPGGLTTARFSPDGRRVVTAGREWDPGQWEARVWDVATGRPVTPPLQHENKVLMASFSLDGRRVVTAGGDDGTAGVWDAQTGQQLLLLRPGGPVMNAEFSPDGRRIVTASYGGTGQVWDAGTGQPVGAPLRHAGPVWRAKFSPDGRRVVTASSDGTARVWEAATGDPLTPPLPGIASGFSPDGRQILMGSATGTVQVWDVSGAEDPVEDLQGWAQVLAGFSLQAPSGQKPLEPEERFQTCERLRAQLSGSRRAATVAGQGWQVGQARRCLDARQWQAAVGHLEALLPGYPEPGPLYAQRGQAHAEMGQWKEAGADFLQVFQGKQEYDLLDGYYLALTQLQVGDVAGVGQTWERLEQHWGKHEDPERSARLVIIGALAPEGVADPTRLVAWAEQAGDPVDVLGAAQYRAGRYDQAVERLTTAPSGRQIAGFKSLFLAMAQHRLGHRTEARGLLAQVEEEMKEKQRPWDQRVAYDLLHREAVALIGK